MTERIWDKYLTDTDKAVMAELKFGALASWGERPALLVIDVNYAFCGEESKPVLESLKTWRTSCGENAWRPVPILRSLIETCRSKQVPVIYTTGTRRADGWDAGSWGYKASPSTQTMAANQRSGVVPSRDGNRILDEVAPGPRDIVIEKQKPSAFSGTPLQSFLQLLGCDSVIVVGGSTSGCVRATVLDAFSQNLRCTVVEDGCFDRLEVSHAMNLCDMHSKYANVIGSEAVMRYLTGLSEGLFELPSGHGMKPY
jgi:maleamate amidohydrolase